MKIFIARDLDGELWGYAGVKPNFRSGTEDFISENHFHIEEEEHPELREVEPGQIWLADQTITLIEKDEDIFNN